MPSDAVSGGSGNSRSVAASGIVLHAVIAAASLSSSMAVRATASSLMDLS